MRVLLADNQARVRSALRRLLEQEPDFNVVGEVTEVEGLLNQMQTIHPDLVLLHWEMPGLQEADFLSNLHCLGCRLKVLAFSARREASQEALAAGADAFVSKGEPVEHLLNTMRTMSGLSSYSVV